MEKLYKDELAEIVYWEAMRRFPENVYFRTQLSRLLVSPRVGRQDVAEKLLWETMDRFPNNEVCCNALAELLAKSGREKDAEDILRKTMDRFPNDEVCRVALAELLAKSGREKEAENTFRETMDRFPDNKVCRVAYCFWLLRWRRTSKEVMTFYDKEIVSLPESPRKAKLRESLGKGKVDDISEIEVPDLWDLMDEINVLDVPEHMQVKEPELGDDVSVPETPKSQSPEEIDVNQEYLPLRENMLVSRADLFLRTSDDEKEQEDELAKLNVILENDPEKIFARLVISLYDENSRRKIASEIDAYYHAYPLRFLAAREIDGKRQWDELLHDFPEHSYLTSLGRLDFEAVDDISNEALKLRKWSAKHNGNGNFEEFAKRKVHDWLFRNMEEDMDMDILAGNLNKNRDEVEIFLKDGLKRAVDENVCYSI